MTHTKILALTPGMKETGFMAAILHKDYFEPTKWGARNWPRLSPLKRIHVAIAWLANILSDGEVGAVIIVNPLDCHVAQAKNDTLLANLVDELKACAVRFGVKLIQKERDEIEDIYKQVKLNQFIPNLHPRAFWSFAALIHERELSFAH